MNEGVGRGLAPVRVLLADDNPVVRDDLGELLREREEVELVGVVEHGRAAVDAVREHAVDVVLLDVEMPVMSGVEATQEIVQLERGTRVLILTAFEQEGRLREALCAGASGFITKDRGIEVIISAVQTVSLGGQVLSPAPARLVQESMVRRAARLREHQEFLDRVSRLPPRLRRVYDPLSRGLTNALIAEELVVSTGTVRIYVSDLLAAVGCSTRAEFIYKAGQVADY